MSLAQQFFDMAIIEVEHVNDSLASRVACAMAGAIGINVDSDSRDTFIRAGFLYLDCIGDYADSAVSREKDKEHPDQALIAAIRELEQQAGRVWLSEYFQLLAADWDERHSD